MLARWELDSGGIQVGVWELKTELWSSHDRGAKEPPSTREDRGAKEIYKGGHRSDKRAPPYKGGQRS
jgi:hypothetical protein